MATFDGNIIEELINSGAVESPQTGVVDFFTDVEVIGGNKQDLNDMVLARLQGESKTMRDLKVEVVNTFTYTGESIRYNEVKEALDSIDLAYGSFFNDEINPLRQKPENKYYKKQDIDSLAEAHFAEFIKQNLDGESGLRWVTSPRALGKLAALVEEKLESKRAERIAVNVIYNKLKTFYNSLDGGQKSTLHESLTDKSEFGSLQRGLVDRNQNSLSLSTEQKQLLEEIITLFSNYFISTGDGSPRQMSEKFVTNMLVCVVAPALNINPKRKRNHGGYRFKQNPVEDVASELTGSPVREVELAMDDVLKKYRLLKSNMALRIAKGSLVNNRDGAQSDELLKEMKVGFEDGSLSMVESASDDLFEVKSADNQEKIRDEVYEATKIYT